MNKNSTAQVGLFALLSVSFFLCLSTMVQGKPTGGDPPCR